MMLSITLQGGNRQDGLKIQRIDSENHTSCQQWRVDAKHRWFSGSVAVWITPEALSRFVAQLRECERTRRGEAKLEAMSPREFELRIFNTRSKGDFALNYQIRDEYWDFPAQLQGGFDLDPSLLPQILRDFEALLAP